MRRTLAPMATATRSGGGAWRRARRIFLDPRAVGVMQAGPRTVRFIRAGATHVQPFQPSFGLAAQVLLDEVLIAAMRNPRLFPHGDDYERAGDDVRAALAIWRREGWLDDPESF